MDLPLDPQLFRWLKRNDFNISNPHTPINVWYAIIYLFPNINGCTVQVYAVDRKFQSTLYNGRNYFFMLGLKLIRVSKTRFSWICGYK